MAVIELKVDDGLVREVGTQAVKAFIDRQLSVLQLECLGEKVSAAIRQSGVDHHAEVEGAREEAWQEYGRGHLKDRL